MTPSSKPRLVVASYLAQVPGSPRGERTQALVQGLRSSWDVELVTGPAPAPGRPAPPAVRRGRRVRRALGTARDALLLDRHEPWSRRALGAWSPTADLGLLVGAPFSFVAVAARRLARAGVPWVLDLGDPWLAGGRPTPAALRARREEAFAWRHAAGGIVTTEEQAADVRRRFPGVPVLVRPNGYPPGVVADGAGAGAARGPGRRLRLAHFGHLHRARVDVAPFLAGLRASGRWEAVELHLYGEDWGGVLDGVRARVEVVAHAPLPWPEAVQEAHRYSAALAIGNHGGIQLPSKVIQYLTLPIPRLAVVADPARDCIVGYLADKPGWLVCAAGDAQAAPRVQAHCARSWAPRELQPPPGEAWPQVAAAVAAFLDDVRAGSHRP
jgi:hypothetical protein